MTTQEMIALLNDDLSNELKHLHFYLYHASAVVGLHREEIREFLLEQAASEMQHVKEFQDLIIGLGGKPTTVANRFPIHESPYNILEYALEMEEEVIKNYAERMEQAATLGDKVDGKWIEVFLEDQMMHSRQDADHMRQLLRG